MILAADTTAGPNAATAPNSDALEEIVDTSFKYTLRTDLIGQFQFTVDETHLMTYKSTPAPGATTQEIAGTYNKQFGFYAKDRGTLGIGWSGWDASALLTAQQQCTLRDTSQSLQCYAVSTY